MKINSDYFRLINSLLAGEKSRPGHRGDSLAPGGGIEQKEISGLAVLVKQELEKLDREADPGRAAYLQELKAKIERGEYRVDPHELAKAMLEK